MAFGPAVRVMQASWGCSQNGAGRSYGWSRVFDLSVLHSLKHITLSAKVQVSSVSVHWVGSLPKIQFLRPGTMMPTLGFLHAYLKLGLTCFDT